MFCMRKRRCSHADDAKIVHTKDAQCNTEESMDSRRDSNHFICSMPALSVLFFSS